MLSAAKTPPSRLTLVFLSAVSILPVNIFTPSLSNMAADFEADYALVSIAIGGYAAVAAALQLVMGPLSDRIGRRPVALAGLAIFALASLGAALAADIWTFLSFRLAQGAIASGYAVSLAIIRDSSEERAAASAIGYMTMAWAVAPMLGPVLGGGLDSLFGWRASFWLLALLGLAVVALVWADLGETRTARTDPTARPFAAYPLLFRSARFWAYAICMAFTTGTFYAFLAGAPLTAETLFGTPPAMIGVYVGSITGGFIAGSFLSGRIAARFPLTTTMIAGRVIACAGPAIALALHLAGAGHPFALFGPCLLVGIGNGLTMPSANAGALSVRPDLAGSAAGLSGALTIAGAAIVGSITGAVLTPANSAYALLGMMLASSVASLVAALAVLSLDRREGRARAT